MARERMVTRTVVVSSIQVMCLDVTTAEVKVNTYELSGAIATPEDALKQVKKLYETETLKCVSVQGMSGEEILYGMSELDFIQQAKILPSRETK